ncbi:MAG: hypothetical protein EP330_15405 [Deltaproteobacteria bacterium]|nr:MAG: hypothetical protein EP330_15405 [Deltaproteobacteria bacterium]
MTTATLPLVWRGRSGRTYMPFGGGRPRYGVASVVRRVTGEAGAVGTSTVEGGVPLALKLWNEGDEHALDQLQEQARVLVELSSSEEELPCPRLYDLVGTPLVTGLVMEWCPVDLELWWREKLGEPDAFGRLMATMAEVCRRVSDYHVFHAKRSGLEAGHGGLKPSNILMADDGRWLLSDFGRPQVAAPDDSPWASSRIIVGSENFVAPELLFHADQPYPAALDTWSLVASCFALLQLRRLILDDGVVPRNGTRSPRFRMHRIHQVVEVYSADPTRFRGQPLDLEAFPDPLELPEQDRKAIRDAVRGIFPTGQEKSEEAIYEQLLQLFDHGMSIDPAHRFTSARDLAAAFEGLTRRYLELTTLQDHKRPAAPKQPGPEVHEIQRLQRLAASATAKSESLERELADTRAELQALRAAIATPAAPPPPPPPSTFNRLLQAAVVSVLLVNLLLLGVGTAGAVFFFASQQ